MKRIKLGSIVKKNNPYKVPYLDGIIGIIIAHQPENEPSLESYKVNWGEYGTFWTLRDNLEIVSEK